MGGALVVRTGDPVEVVPALAAEVGAAAVHATADFGHRWVPELAHAEGVDVHAPWRFKRGMPRGYDAPMVDHAAEREEWLRRYELTKGSRA